MSNIRNEIRRDSELNSDLKVRTKKFAVETIRFCSFLPKTQEVFVIKNQLIRSATSVGANYRAACRARSRADFIAKLSIVEEEADESVYWFELLELQNIVNIEKLRLLKDEAHQLVAIIVASKKTARKYYVFNNSKFDNRHSKLHKRG